MAQSKNAIFTFYRREFNDFEGYNGFDNMLCTLEVPEHKWPRIDEVTVTLDKVSKNFVLYGKDTKLKGGL